MAPPKGWRPSPEQNARQRAAQTGGHIKRVTPAWNKGLSCPRGPLSEETKKRISDKAILRYQDPKARKKTSDALIGLKRPFKAKSKIHRERISEANKGKKKSPEHIAKIMPFLYAGLIASWADPEKKSARIKKILSNSGIHPNFLESKFIEFLEETYPGQFEYVGDGSLIIGGKNPDFCHTSASFLIEIYGDYWHAGEDPQERIDYFSTYGYKTIVLWETEVRAILASSCARACPVLESVIAKVG